MSHPPSQDGTSPEIQIRPYSQEDRARVRELCCETGFLGNPVDPIFEDRELFADFLTTYYTDQEPASSFVLVMDGVVKGYLLGAKDHTLMKSFQTRHFLKLIPKILWRYPGYGKATKHYLHWLAWRGWRETPPAPADTAHFHINLLPEARKVSTTRHLIDAFLKYLRESGEKRVYGQMVSIGNRRGERMFERYGFRLMNRMEVTKFRGIHPEPVFLCTVVKDLEERVTLYQE